MVNQPQESTRVSSGSSSGKLAATPVAKNQDGELTASPVLKNQESTGMNSGSSSSKTDC